MRKGRVLVTGATGFVGRALVSTLEEHGYPLTLAVRRPVRDTGPDRRLAVVGSIGRGTDWRDALRDVSAVVHLAGHVHVAPERAESEAHLFDEVNHHGSLTLFRAAAAAGVRLFVFASSITVLGAATRPGEPFTDASPPRPRTPYARSKLDAERALTAAAALGATRLVILRPPLVVGAGVGGNLARLLRLAALPMPLPLGGVHNRRTVVTLDGLVAAIVAVLERGENAASGTYVLGEREALSTSGMLCEFRAGLGRRPWLLPVPAGLLGRVLATLGRAGLAERLFGSLEVDGSRFRAVFAPQPGPGPRAALRDAARAWQAARDTARS